MLKALMIGGLFTLGVSQPVTCGYDVNCDGGVDVGDAIVILNHFGERVDSCHQVGNADPGDELRVDGWLSSPESTVEIAGWDEPALAIETDGAFVATWIAALNTGTYDVLIDGTAVCQVVVL